MQSYLHFLSRNKVYTFITVLGLSVSLMFIILIGDYAWRQYSIDSQHPEADRICVMGSHSDFFMWPQVGREVQALCPEVEKTCCVLSQSGKIKHGDQELKDTGHGIILLTDSTFFDFFRFPVVVGDVRSALSAPDRCIITESLARKFFPNGNPIGQELQLVGQRSVFMGNQDPYDSTLVYTVAAVVEDLDRTVLPSETQVIASMKRHPQVMGYELTNDVMAYGSTGCCKVFLMLRPGASLDNKKAVISNHLRKNYHIWDMFDKDFDFTLTPLREIMFAPQNNGLGLEKGDRSRLYILLSAVLAILFFAVSNYINLTVANTGFRAKEMATRRLFGSTGTAISLKLIAESTLMVAVSFAIGLGLALYFQEEAVELFRGKIALLRDINPGTVSISLLFILLVGIVSGILPSWQLSRYQPIDIVKGTFRFRSRMVLGRVFIVVQNIITVVMLTAGLVIWLQLRHMIQAPLGYNTKNLFYLSPEEKDCQTVRDRLEAMPFVESVGAFGGTSFTTNSTSMLTLTREDKHIMLYATQVDSTAFSLYGLEILKKYGETDGGYYLNEEAMRQLEYTDTTRLLDFGNGEKVPIAGILKDFHKGNILNPAQPFYVRLKKEIKPPYYLVKTNGDKRAKEVFKQMFRDLDCNPQTMEWRVSSLEEDVAESFEEQQNTLRIISLFALVAVVISVMGFVGMALFFVRQRKKEIGIRKILGSTSGEVTLLMLRIFCAPLVLSFLVAVPLAWYILEEWLKDFSYRIALSPWMFLVTCLSSLLVALLSVGYLIVRTARANPVESIKVES